MHLHFGCAGRRARMNQHGQGKRVDLFPDRREGRVRQRTAVDVGEHHDAYRAVCDGAPQFADCSLRVLPRQRRHPAQPARMLDLGLRHVVIGDLRGARADRLVSEIDIGASQGEDRQVDAVRVHVLDPQCEIEMAGHRRHERCAVDGDALAAGAASVAGCNGGGRVRAEAPSSLGSSMWVWMSISIGHPPQAMRVAAGGWPSRGSVIGRRRGRRRAPRRSRGRLRP